jgi:dienelactone hydrolase
MHAAPIFQRKSLTRLLQGGALGVVATLIIGFCWGGWVTASTAREMVRKSAGIAVVAALAPICVERWSSLRAAGFSGGVCIL